MLVSNEHDCIFWFENGDNGGKTWLDAVLGADWYMLANQEPLVLFMFIAK